MNNAKTEALLQLVRENPDLPVIPFVWYEICCEDHSYWMGSLGDCVVEEYATYDGRFYTDKNELKEQYYDDNEDLFEGLSSDEIETLLEKKTGEWWTTAIVVYIELPDSKKEQAK